MKPERPLVIDAQLLQTTAWDRGMGHYCRSLLKALGELPQSPSVTLLFNENLPLEAARKAELKKNLPRVTIEMLDLPTLTGDIPGGQQKARHTLDAFMRKTFKGETVDFLILQLFTFDYVAAFPTDARKLLLMYDLIPLLHWEHFSRLFAPHMYFPHFTTILEADHLLAISETTGRQLQECLSISPKRITNLNGAAIVREAAASSTAVKSKTRFVLMPSADFPHKNNLNAVQAFARINRELGDLFSLVITSTFSDDTKALLSCFCEKLIFTGNISNEELEYLYRRSEALMLTSSIEGLGLPILEAVQQDKPVVCSSIDVFKEISKTAFYFCDPADVSSIADALKQAFVQSDWDAKKEEYRTIRKTLSWQAAAEKLQSVLGGDDAGVQHRSGQLQVALPHPSVATSWLGGYAQALAPILAAQIDSRFYVADETPDGQPPEPYFLPYLTVVDDLAARQHSRSRRKPLYFIDGSAASAGVLAAAVIEPGVCFIGAADGNEAIEMLATQQRITPEVATALHHFKLQLSELLQASGNTVWLIDPRANTAQPYKAENAEATTARKSGSRQQIADLVIELTEPA